MKKFVLKLNLHDDKEKQKALKTVSTLSGIDAISMDMKEKKLTVIGTVDPVTVVIKLRKFWPTEMIAVGPAKDPEKKTVEPKKEEAKKGEKKEKGKKEEAKKDEKKDWKEEEKKKEGKKEESIKYEKKKEEAKKEASKTEDGRRKKSAPEPVSYVSYVEAYTHPVSYDPVSYRETYSHPVSYEEDIPNACVIC